MYITAHLAQVLLSREADGIQLNNTSHRSPTSLLVTFPLLVAL
jgi:hypothetical protein